MPEYIMDGTELLCLADADHDGYEQVVVQGSWKGHWQGSFEINEAMIDQMLSFGNSRKIATPLDYGHELTYNNAADASGWVEPGNFEKRGKGKKASLWARFDLTEPARLKVASKELRYKSPTITWNTTDRKSGRTGGSSLHSIALTNTPFLHELDEIRLNSIMSALNNPQLKEELLMNEEQLKALAAKFGLGEDATADQIMLASTKFSILSSIEHPALSDSEFVILSNSDHSALQLRASSADGAQQSLATLQARVDKMDSEKRDEAALALVRSYQAQGKVAGDDTPNFKHGLATAKANPESFKALMDSTSPWVAGSDPVAKASNGDSINSVTKEINSKLGLSDEDYNKYGKVD